jgi:hypothetical protein
MKLVIKIILRLIAFPFFSVLSLIYALFLWLLYSYNFLRYGGEAVAYTKGFNAASATDALREIQKLVNSDKNDERIATQQASNQGGNAGINK